MGRTRPAAGGLRPLGFVLAALLLSGCGEVDYYTHLAQGQARILWDQRPVAEVLADTSVSAHLRRRLALVRAICAFAQDIGLPAEGHYERFHDTGGQPVAWNVSASPPDRFQAYLWSFPVVGDLPYKGFFTQVRAEAERDRLAAAGYDVVARPVSAYSTLGWLPDPVLSTMLERRDADLADLILHELTHAAVYAEGQTDYNESVATFIGRAGSLRFLAERDGEDAPSVTEARDRRRLAARFADFMRGATARLDSLYGLELPRDEVLTARQRLFDEIKQDYRRQRDDLGAGAYDGFLSWEINNARLLSYRRYHRDLGRFAAVLEMQGDLAAALRVFVACGETDDPWACLPADADPSPVREESR